MKNVKLLKAVVINSDKRDDCCSNCKTTDHIGNACDKDDCITLCLKCSMKNKYIRYTMWSKYL